jgi:hypothetical protein
MNIAGSLVWLRVPELPPRLNRVRDQNEEALDCWKAIRVAGPNTKWPMLNTTGRWIAVDTRAAILPLERNVKDSNQKKDCRNTLPTIFRPILRTPALCAHWLRPPVEQAESGFSCSLWSRRSPSCSRSKQLREEAPLNPTACGRQSGISCTLANDRAHRPVFSTPVLFSEKSKDLTFPELIG